MNDQNRCIQCGSELAADAPQGLCPACLLKKALETQSKASGVSGQSDNTDFVPPTPAELAVHFPELDILEFIGRGGMGMVYKARQKHLDRLVALKILLPRIGSDPAFAERFSREARAMAMLAHQNIITVHDFGQTSTPLVPSGRGAGGEGTLYYFLMEFVDGVTLRKLLDAGKLDPKEALAIVPQICDALQYAHDNGVVHRDIKPENILLDKSGRVKIADFGLAKLVARQGQDVTLTGVGQVMGTPHYMAPEQMEHPQDVDHRADIYSLGVVFYQMLTGELPLGRFAPPSKKVHIDVRLDEVVLRALEKEPEQRYQQASEIKSHVETIITTPPHESAAGSASVLSPDDAAIEQARRQVKGPAIGLLVAGMLICLAIPMILFVLSWDLELNPPPSRHMILVFLSIAVFVLVSLIPGSFTIFAALKMKRLQAYGLANAAGILTIIASPAFFFIGLPIGIWALIVLGQRDVRKAFKHARATGSASDLSPVDAKNHHDTPLPSTGNASGTHRKDWRSWVMMIGVRDGKKVANWPVVVLLCPLVFLVYYVVYVLNNSWSKQSLSILLMFLVYSASIIAFLMWVQSLRSVEQLPLLDSPQPQKPRAIVDDDAIAQARQHVRGPAIGLLVTGIIDLLASFRWVLLVVQSSYDVPKVVLVMMLLSVNIAYLLVFAGLMMLRLQAYGLAVAAGIAAVAGVGIPIIVLPINWICLPIGIWTLVVLSQREVRAAFRC